MFYNLKENFTIGDILNEALKELILSYPENKLVYASKLSLLSKHYCENLKQNNVGYLQQDLEIYKIKTQVRFEELDSVMAYRNYLLNKVEALRAEISDLDEVIEQRKQFVTEDEVIRLTKKYKEGNE